MIAAPSRPTNPLRDPSRLNSLAGYGILDTLPEPGFDDIVNLARQICGMPVGLVSLVGEDRQWFKARAGFERCEVPLDQSVCTHTLTGPGLLVIPDLSKDPRTRDNPLVAGDPHLRFYAGAPLRAPGGEHLGALCVMGHEPRPSGLTPEQAGALQALARQVMIQLEFRSRAKAHEAVLEAQRAIQDAAGDLDAILDAVVAGVIRAVPQAEGAAVELREGDELALRSARGSLAEHVGLRIPVQGSLAGDCLLSGEPVICTDALQDPRVNPEAAERFRTRSCLLVPVARAGGVLGVVRLHSGRPGAFTPADLEVVRLFAGTVVAGLAEAGEAEARRESRRSEERYRAVFENAVDFAVIVLDLEGRITDWNEGATRILGWSPEEMLGRHAETFFTPEDREAGILDHELQSALTAGRGIDERWHLRRDGSRFWASGQMMPLRDEAGVATGFVKILRDRTQQREAGVALEESELRYRSLVEVSPQVVWFGDAEGNITYCNSYWYDYTGLPPDEVAEASWTEAIHPDYRQRVRDAWLAAAREGDTYEVEFPLRRGADGQYRWFLSRGRPVRDEAGGIQSWIGVSIDIHERKLAEQRFRALTELAPSIIWFSDPDGRISYLNDRWYAYTGQTPEQAMPFGWAGALHPDDVEPLQGVWARARVRNEFYEGEARFRGRDGAYRWFLVRAEPLRDERGEVLGWIGTDTDIHDRRQAEEALREAEDQLRLAIEAANLGIFDHDLRTGEITWDARARTLFGVGPNAPSTRETLRGAIHPQDFEQVRSDLQAALDPAGPGIYETEYRTVGLEDVVERVISARGRCMFEGGVPVRLTGALRDITAKRRAERSLNETAERYRLAARATNDAIWDWDFAADRILWNEALQTSYGYNPARVDHSGEWRIGHIHPGDRERVTASMQAVIDGTGTAWSAEYRFLRSDGSYAHVYDRGYVIRRADGRATRMIGAMLDLSEQKRAEAALRKSERQLSNERGFLRAIFQQAPLGISIAGATPDVPATLNARAQEMLGHGPGEPGDERYASYGAIHADGRPYALGDYPTLRALRQGEVIRAEEVRYRNARTGEVRRLEVSSAPVRDEAGEIRAAVTLLADVEDQRRAEAEIRRLAAIVEQSTDFIGIARADGRVEYVNEAGRRMVGLTHLDATRRTSLRDYFAEEDWPFVEETILPTVAEHGAWVDDYRFRNHVTGATVPVHCNLFALLGPTGAFEGYATVTRDITERKQAEARQDFLNRELSHRMKNLLAMVQAITVQTMRGATDLPTVREVLVNRLITLGKAHDMLLEGAAESTPIGPVIRNGVGVQDDGSGRVSYAGPEVEISGKAALSLAMMVHELATNAAKYGALSAPGGRVDVNWSVDEVEGEPWLLITWGEQGGPPVSPPTSKGFGSRLIQRGLSGQVGGSVRLDYLPAGVLCTVEAPLRGFQQDG
ncbi:PAS domain S-box protein [Methylobacterium sp. WSM2598]|uniref:PAS domain S-box protein n=1 Tax=Methylobacterium sp. WSM2598 TaxID=398261 RepID=UPI00037EA804|nr:PAS domain S-box protein [Methylobacterium sp. WSM2598]